MTVNSTFAWMPQPAQKRLFWLSFAVTIVVLAAMNISGAPLNTAVSPAGIISFEFAGSFSYAACMMASWGEYGREVAAFNLGLDYLFLVTYSITISLGCGLVAGASRGGGRRTAAWAVPGAVLSWLLFVAAGLDAVENYALLRAVLGSTRDLWPALARACAIPKFLIVLSGLLYMAIGAVGRIAGRLRRG